MPGVQEKAAQHAFRAPNAPARRKLDASHPLG